MNALTFFRLAICTTICVVCFACGAPSQSSIEEDNIVYDGDIFVIDRNQNWKVASKNEIRNHFINYCEGIGIDTSKVDSIEIKEVKSIDFFPLFEKKMPATIKYFYDISLSRYESFINSHPERENEITKPVYDTTLLTKKFYMPEIAMFFVKGYQLKGSKLQSIQDNIYMPCKNRFKDLDCYQVLTSHSKFLNSSDNLNLNLIYSKNSSLFEEEDMRTFFIEYARYAAQMNGYDTDNESLIYSDFFYYIIYTYLQIYM